MEKYIFFNINYLYNIKIVLKNLLQFTTDKNIKENKFINYENSLANTTIFIKNFDTPPFLIVTWGSVIMHFYNSFSQKKRKEQIKEFIFYFHAKYKYNLCLFQITDLLSKMLYKFFEKI